MWYNETKLNFLIDNFWDRFYEEILKPLGKQGKNTDTELEIIKKELSKNEHWYKVNNLYNIITEKGVLMELEQLGDEFFVKLFIKEIKNGNRWVGSKLNEFYDRFGINIQFQYHKIILDEIKKILKRWGYE